MGSRLNHCLKYALVRIVKRIQVRRKQRPEINLGEGKNVALEANVSLGDCASFPGVGNGGSVRAPEDTAAVEITTADIKAATAAV
jgi:hypothetical protein